jgi:hypothetical protein
LFDQLKSDFKGTLKRGSMKNMRNSHCDETFSGNIAGALGKGLIAGLIGTIAITISQMVEMKVTDRKPSSTPRQAAEKVFGVTARDELSAGQLNNFMHFSYGTSLGVIRGLLVLCGLKGILGTLVHITAVQSLAITLLPKMKLAPPVREWGAKAIMTELMHHGIYGFAAGIAYDFMNRCRKKGNHFSDDTRCL